MLSIVVCYNQYKLKNPGFERLTFNESMHLMKSKQFNCNRHTSCSDRIGICSVYVVFLLSQKCCQSCHMVCSVLYLVSFSVLFTTCIMVCCTLSFEFVAIFDRSGRYVITGSDDRLVKIWSMETAFCLTSCRGHEVSLIMWI